MMRIVQTCRKRVQSLKVMGCQQLKSENSSKCSDQNQENVCKTIYLDSDVLYGMHMTTDET